MKALGVGIVGISTDSAEDSRAFAKKIGIHFPLIADPGLEIATAYGVAGSEVAIPAVFVVAQDRTITWHYIGESARDRPTSELVLEQVETLTAKPKS